MTTEDSNWKTLYLGDVTFESKARLGSSKEMELSVYGVDRQIGLTAEAKYIGKNLERYKFIQKGMFAYNPMRLNIGSIGYCSTKHAPGLVSPDYVVFGCEERLLLPDFLKYVIKGPAWVRWTTDAGVGSVRVRIYYKELAKFQLALPPVAKQYAVTHILGTLDDKIELNSKMNATLEQMAQALFKSWFVDFDPVKAKQQGSEPEGMDAESATLFPSEFEESELGLIPKGWRIAMLEEAFDINPARKLAKSGTATYLDMGNVPTSGHRPNAWIKRTVGSGTRFTNGDTLLARITPCLENGKTAFVDFLSENEVGWGSTEFIVLRPKQGLPDYFAYLLCRREDFRAFAIQSMTGTSGRQRVQTNSLAKYKLALPESGSLIGMKFGEVIAPLAKRIKAASEESTILVNLRDALLPKLISGQLRIPDAERLAGAAL